MVPVSDNDPVYQMITVQSIDQESQLEETVNIITSEGTSALLIECSRNA